MYDAVLQANEQRPRRVINNRLATIGKTRKGLESEGKLQVAATEYRMALQMDVQKVADTALYVLRYCVACNKCTQIQRHVPLLKAAARWLLPLQLLLSTTCLHI